MSSNIAPMKPVEVNVSSFILLPQEAAFVAYTCKRIKQMLDNGMTDVFLSFDAKMQSSFKNWVELNITQISFSENELDLHVIVNSIWDKTKKYVEGAINASLNQEVIAEENMAQRKAVLITEDLIKKEYEGKVFTLRQSVVLVDTAKKANWF